MLGLPIRTWRITRTRAKALTHRWIPCSAVGLSILICISQACHNFFKLSKFGPSSFKILITYLSFKIWTLIFQNFGRLYIFQNVDPHLSKLEHLSFKIWTLIFPKFGHLSLKIWTPIFQNFGYYIILNHLLSKFASSFHQQHEAMVWIFMKLN